MNDNFTYPSPQPTYWLKDLILLTLGISLFYGLFLGSYPLTTPDEGRYSEIPQQMLILGNFITPHINYIKYLEKPPLFYWLQAFAISIGGLSEWALRAVNALFGMLGCLITYLAGYFFYNRQTGIYASIILATSLLYYLMSHLITLDITLTFWLTLCLFSLLSATQCTNPAKIRVFMYIAAVSAALAVLTKGLIGVIFPAIIFGMWLTINYQWLLLRKLYLPTSLFIFLLIALPWHILVQLQNPDFFHFYFIEQQFYRYLTHDEHRYHNIIFYVPVLIVGLFPWIFFLPAAIRQAFPSSWQARHTYQKQTYLLLWATIIFLFYSFSDSKLIPYLLPAFPPLAILIAAYLNSLVKQLQVIKLALIAIMLIAITSFFTLLILHFLLNEAWQIMLIPVGIGLGCVIALKYLKYNIKYSLLFLAFGTALSQITALAILPNLLIDSIKPLAVHSLSVLKPNDRVVCYNSYFQDLPVYLQRRIDIVDWQGELHFGITHQDVKEWVYDDAKLWQEWNSPQRVFIFTRLSHYQQLLKQYPQEHFYILGQTKKFILLCNQEIKL